MEVTSDVLGDSLTLILEFDTGPWGGVVRAKEELSLQR
jgi:hypothetical protein